MINFKIRTILDEYIKKFKVEVDSFAVERPVDTNHGDYSTNLAMVLSEIAEEIKKNIKSDMFEKIEVVKPGFINFFLSEKVLNESTSEIINKKDKFGDSNINKGQKIQVEFISANPTGPLTVANTRGGFTGDTLSNVLEKTGAKVKRAYYVNNYGNQILVLGHSVLKDEEGQYAGEYIDELNKKNTKTDPYEVGVWATEFLIEEAKKTVSRMGVEFDEWFLESKLHDSGIIDKALNILEKKGFLYEKEGATWFKSEEFGDNRDRVVVKSDENKSKTYLGSDAGWHLHKFEKDKFDKVINIWGADHHGDVKGLMGVVEALGHKDKLDIILIQFVTLMKDGKEVRMSKRKGNYVTIDDLLDEVDIDVARFFFLEKSSDKHLNFDLGLAKEQSDKNPVFYIQYANARISSILDKTKLKGKADLSLLKEKSERDLIIKLIKFPEIVQETAKDYGVHRLTTYAMEIASAFHSFYNDQKVITEDEKLTRARAELCLATKTILKNTLSLMGVSVPDKM
jgi:arginyl-tRNA synthetase